MTSATFPVPEPVPLRDRVEAEAYVASVCFKHGPPRLAGIELEWTVHHAEDPTAALDISRLSAALADYAPPTLAPTKPHTPLPNGSLVTVEPGGQVEISSPANTSPAALLAGLAEDMSVLVGMLTEAGLTLGSHGIDPHRAPTRLLDTPRYCAMESAFEPIGPDGLAMMCSTAGVQVCIDAGEKDRTAARWRAAHALGPVLCAMFGNTAPGSSWVSARQRAVFGSDPVRMRPAAVTADPAAAWARRVLNAEVICVRSLADSWRPSPPVSFADWVEHGIPGAAPPTTEDLDYHLSTMFPPVRPHGYIEIRYVDAQPGDGWVVPAMMLIALFAGEDTVERVLAAAAPAAGRWLHGARYGLADPPIARAATDLVRICADAIAATDIDDTLAAHVVGQLHRRLAGTAAAA